MTPSEPRIGKGQHGGGEVDGGRASGEKKALGEEYKPGDRIISVKSGDTYEIASVDDEGSIHVKATKNVEHGFVIWPEDQKGYKRLSAGIAIPDEKSDFPAEFLHSMGGDMPRFNELIELSKRKVKELGTTPIR